MSAEADIIEIDRSRPSYGDWASEEASAAEFDRRVEACGLFERVFREVDGYYCARRPNREEKNAAIDRILMPGKRLIEAGWTRDIGVELKRSNEKIGRPLAQAIDYTWCVWYVGRHLLVVENIFLWPFRRQHRALESIMLQNGVGVVDDSSSASLIFQLEKQVIRIERDGSFQVQAPTSGRKVGSR